MRPCSAAGRGYLDAAPQAAAGGSVAVAAFSLAGQRLAVVLVSLNRVQSPDEPEMLVADLRPRFRGAEIVLVGQDDHGAPKHYRRDGLLTLLAAVPVDRMPWETYAV